MTYQTTLTALADPTRRQIFEAVAAEPSSVGLLAVQLPVSRPAVSQHLKALSDAGLVNVTKQGTRNIYAACPDGLADLRRYLEQLWGDVLTSFANDIAKESQSD
ncbi:MAG: metalloregulator ArsR/SmtB family transcription factor [Rhodobacteraceae bacterium]|nr:metalloregulator ArsR/SmtB family transcription factor [Paracoccaceae bacterium]